MSLEQDISDEAVADTVEDTAGDTAEARADSDADEATEPVQTAGPTDAPPASEPETPDLAAQLERTHAVVERIDTSLVAFHQRAAEYEATNRLLHSRVEELQQDQVRALLKPVFERLASLHAQATEMADKNRSADAGSADEFDYFATTIDELLALYDLDSVAAAAGQVFDSKKHHAARIKTTDDQALDSIVHKVHRQGYTLAGADRVLLPARVSVYRYAAPVPAADSAPATADLLS
jgi:molecular chaperone GrpE (heat shock protein)